MSAPKGLKRGGNMHALMDRMVRSGKYNDAFSKPDEKSTGTFEARRTLERLLRRGWLEKNGDGGLRITTSGRRVYVDLLREIRGQPPLDRMA